jgi:hypothetical protein
MTTHLFVGQEGNLYDTRKKNWSKKPIRKNFCRHHAAINSFADLKATLRAGEFAWPGGYQLYLITAAGEELSFEGAKETLICQRDAWKIKTSDRVVACAVNYENQDMFCIHTCKPIPASY